MLNGVLLHFLTETMKKREITISRHAIFVESKNLESKEENNDESAQVPIWWLPITRLYSGYKKGDFAEKYGLKSKIIPASFSGPILMAEKCTIGSKLAKPAEIGLSFTLP